MEWRLRRGPVFKHLGQTLHNRPLPLANLRRMHLILACNLCNRFYPSQCFQSHFGLSVRLKIHER